MATKEEKESMNRLEACFKSILRKPSPQIVLSTVDTSISTHSEPTNCNNRSYSSGYSGGYYSSGENLNGSSGFSQSGGAHHNFYGRVSRL